MTAVVPINMTLMFVVVENMSVAPCLWWGTITEIIYQSNWHPACMFYNDTRLVCIADYDISIHGAGASSV